MLYVQGPLTDYSNPQIPSAIAPIAAPLDIHVESAWWHLREVAKHHPDGNKALQAMNLVRLVEGLRRDDVAFALERLALAMEQTA